MLAAHQVMQHGWLSAEQAQPVYLRDNVADKPKPRLEPNLIHR
jgi:hypothetical protein